MLWNSVFSFAYLAALAASPITAAPTDETLYRRGNRYYKAAARFVWRGDNRSPNTLRQQGGFAPQGQYWNLPNEFATIENHISGRRRAADPSSWGTAFVSVSRDVERAFNYGHWLYLIDASPNIVDPDPDTRAENSESDTSSDEDDEEVFLEEFAIGGVPWRQVIGWIWIPHNAYNDPEFPPNVLNHLRNDPLNAGAGLRRNPDHDTRFQSLSVTRIDPRRPEYSDYQTRPRSGWRDFMNRLDQNAQAALGWEGEFPLSLPRLPSEPDRFDEPRPGQSEQEDNFTPEPRLTAPDVVVMAEHAQQYRNEGECPAQFPWSEPVAGPSSANDGAQFQQQVQRQVQQTATLIRQRPEPILPVLTNEDVAEVLRDLSLPTAGSTLCHFMGHCFGPSSGPQKRQVGPGSKVTKRATSTKEKQSFQSVCRKLKTMRARQNFGHLHSVIEVLSVRIDDIDGENPGDLYGQISLSDLQGKQLIYNISQSMYQEVKAGDEISLIKPLRTFEPGDKSLSITFDLTDYDWFKYDNDDPISQGTIVPSKQQGSSGQIRTQQVKGKNGAVTIKYVVFEEASIATIHMYLRDADDEASSKIYGQIRASMGNSGSRTLWLHDKGIFDKGEKMKPNSAFGLQRNMVAVGAKDKLIIEANLQAYGWISSEVAKGTVEFAAGKKGTRESKVLSGEYGKVEVTVFWS